MSNQPVKPAHPMQPIYIDKEGVARFRPNALARFLLDWSSSRGMSLNDLALMSFDADEHEHFAQLIGYSVSGFGDLSYVSCDVYDRAAHTVTTMLSKTDTIKEESAMEIERDGDCAIYKYPLPLEDKVVINMPSCADVLCVQVQGDQPCLWAKVMKSASPQPRVFYVVGTGHNMPVAAQEYVGTFQLDNGALVYHVFEG